MGMEWLMQLALRLSPDERNCVPGVGLPFAPGCTAGVGEKGKATLLQFWALCALKASGLMKGGDNVPWARAEVVWAPQSRSC